LPKNFKDVLLNYSFLFMIAVPIILIDQLTKFIVRTNVPLGNVYQPGAWLSQYARIIHWKNTGIALGILPQLGDLFTITSSLITLAILILFPFVSHQERNTRIGLAFMLGGAIGNLIDRYQHGYVLDFLSIGSFPVINIADACISTGVAIIAISYWISEKKPKDAQVETVHDENLQS
jgi:signal peptidase II